MTQPAIADIERSAHDTSGQLLERLLACSGHRLISIPSLANTAADWADEIYRELRSSRRSEEVAFRALIGLSDDLASATAAIRVALCAAPPAPCGDSRWDASVAAVVDHHLTRARLPVPEWVRERSRVLDEEWVVSPFTDARDVPPAFRRHGVRLAASELASV